jgi:small-conductance mechanosensitive channel
MSSVGWLTDRVNRWFSIRQPVTYWSFWGDLLRLAPVLVTLFALFAVALGTQFSVLTFAPLPYVFVAATSGFAVRDLDLLGGLWSGLLGVVYGFVLWVTNVGPLLLQRPTPVLSAVAVLTFVALVVGFSAPSLHGRRANREFEAAYRRHHLDDDDDDD